MLNNGKVQAGRLLGSHYKFWQIQNNISQRDIKAEGEAHEMDVDVDK